MNTFKAGDAVLTRVATPVGATWQRATVEHSYVVNFGTRRYDLRLPNGHLLPRVHDLAVRPSL